MLEEILSSQCVKGNEEVCVLKCAPLVEGVKECSQAKCCCEMPRGDGNISRVLDGSEKMSDLFPAKCMNFY